MRPDPTLKRIREARYRISEKCGHDPKRVIEYYMQRQKRHGDRLAGSPESTLKQKPKDDRH